MVDTRSAEYQAGYQAALAQGGFGVSQQQQMGPQAYPGMPSSYGGWFNLMSSNPNASRQQLTFDGKATDKVIDAVGADGVKEMMGLDSMSKWTNIGTAIGGFALAGVQMGFQFYNAGKYYDALDSFQQKQKELGTEWITLQGNLAEISERLDVDRNDTMVELAEIKAQVETEKARIQKETSIANTKTVASYGYLNGKMYGYGNPAISSNIYMG